MTNYPAQNGEYDIYHPQLVMAPKQNYYRMANPVFVNLLSYSGWNSVFGQGHCRKQCMVLLKILLKGIIKIKKIIYFKMEATHDLTLSNFRNIKIVIEDTEGRLFFLDKKTLIANTLLPCCFDVHRINPYTIIRNAAGKDQLIDGTNITFDNLRIDDRPIGLPCINVADFTITRSNGEINDEVPASYIEMHEFHKDIDMLKSEQDKWLYLLKNMGSLTKIPEIFNNKFFRPIFKYARFSRLNEVEKKKYQSLRIEY